jgi:hypothetical protein
MTTGNCEQVQAGYVSERAELARRYRAVGLDYGRKVALAAGSAAIVGLLSRHAGETMAWFYLAWFGSVGLFALVSYAREVRGWFHAHDGYVSVGGYAWGCTVCGRPPKECASEAPARD